MTLSKLSAVTIYLYITSGFSHLSNWKNYISNYPFFILDLFHSYLVMET